mgnify:CR=1 FL=1|jgi:alkanesulfonate monooxygenase SsuD/methylene tetrahydromethanopterin reductase-like flavin-dependent oxidoreductase (luciferase family)
MEPVLPRPDSLESPVPPQDLQPVITQVAHAENAPNVAAEKSREVAPAPVLQQPLSQPVPVVDNQTTNSSLSGQQASSDPQIADDVDVIEKEWVDKAKKIVTATKDNPHQQEKEVSKLQADYLMKRYNKQVKLSE